MHGRRSFPFFGGRITPTRKLIRKTTSVKDLRLLSEKVTLEKVFGLTTLNSNGLACNPVTGILAYPAGCVIVLLDPYTNSQSHIFNPEKKTLTSLAFSSDGKYLASGECGHNPCVRIWELGETPTKVTELKGHKYAINCVGFSPNMKYLVSIGDQHDMSVNIWNWRTGSKAACNKIGCKVRSVFFAENGSYFVTVGNRHVKFWYFDTEASSKLNVPTPLQGRSGILGEQKNNYFCDVVCGIGKNATNTYCITKSGKLCAFSAKRLLDRWVELRCSGANCLAANEDYIFCGCSNGIIRVFDPISLKFLCTLPRPHSLGTDVAQGLDASHMVPKTANAHYPDVLAMVLDRNGKKLTCIYNDHSMYIWDVSDVRKVGKSSSFLYHSGCIWGVESYPVLEDSQNPRLPPGSFLTCSSDDTVRVWNIEEGCPSNRTFPRNIYSKELLKIIYCDEELSNIQDMSGILPAPAAESKTGIRCLQVSPDGQLLAAGDRSGNLRVYDLQFVDELIKIEAHDSEILCVEFSRPESGFKLLVTSSRDRLIHIFDINQDFALLQTIDDHSSSITAVRFNYDNETFQLLSCGADKHIMFHTAQINNNGSIHFVRNTIVVGKATMYDMDIEPTRKFAATVGVDRNVRIYDIQGAKQTQCYKGSLSDDGTVIKIQLDPSGLYAATSCSDKSVCVYEFESGDCNAVMYGHSELVLGLKFTVDGRRLISVSGDGCIFIWKLPNSFRQAILMRLQELHKTLPDGCQIDTDPLSSIRRTTFLVPPRPDIDLRELSDKDEMFEEGSSRLFDETDGDDGVVDYRFSVGRLPAWAKKQIIGDEDSLSQPAKEFVAPALPGGRWGQRIGGGSTDFASRLDSTSFGASATTDTIDEVLPADDGYECGSVESQYLLKAKSVPNLSIMHEDSESREALLATPIGLAASRDISETPYSSHKRARSRKDETFSVTDDAPAGGGKFEKGAVEDVVIYPPASHEDYDEEVASSFEVTANSLTQGRKSSGSLSPQRRGGGDSAGKDKTVTITDGQGILESEEFEDGSDVEAEGTPSDGEAAGSEDEDNESPLKHHFERLASDALGEGEDAVTNDAGSSDEMKITKELMYRASISAKFLSRSQQTRMGSKTSENADSQRRLLESLAKVLDQNGGEINHAENRPETSTSLETKSSITDTKKSIPPSSSLENSTVVNEQKGTFIADGCGEIPQAAIEQESDQPVLAEDGSPIDRQKSTSDLIALFNQRSSTPAGSDEKKPKSRINQSQGSNTGTPVLSPISSPKRRHPPFGEKSVKFDLSPQEKRQSVSDSSSRQVQSSSAARVNGKDKVRMRRTVRPKLNKGSRPKSLILPSPIVLDNTEEKPGTKCLSDTELDEREELPPYPTSKGSKRKLAKSASPTKNPSKTFVTPADSRSLRREIDIDEKISQDTKESRDTRVVSANGGVASSQHRFSSKRGTGVLESVLPHPEQKIVSSDKLYLFECSSPNVYYNSTPPERDLGPASVNEFNDVDDKEGRASSASLGYCSTNGELHVDSAYQGPDTTEVDQVEDMEVSVEKCGAVISDFVSSLKQVSTFHEAVLAHPSSAMQREILGMLSASYVAIESKIRHMRERGNDVCTPQPESLVTAPDLSSILKSLDEVKIGSTDEVSANGLPDEFEPEVKPIMNLLQSYSSALVALVSRRLEREKEFESG